MTQEEEEAAKAETSLLSSCAVLQAFLLDWSELVARVALVEWYGRLFGFGRKR